MIEMHTNYALPDATDHTYVDNKDINQMVSYNISSCSKTDPLESHDTRDARDRKHESSIAAGLPPETSTYFIAAV